MVVKAKASAALVITRRANGKIVIDYSFKRTLGSLKIGVEDVRAPIASRN